MASKCIGEFLSALVPITGHDIDEILAEQSVSHTRRSFGDIALSMRLCRPEDIWQAWCNQLIDGPPKRIDLDAIGVDTQALGLINSQIAHELRVIPLRLLGETLIVAIDEDSIAIASQLGNRVQKQLRFALADSGSIRRALLKHYPLT